MQRPTSVAVIGWLAVGFGSLAVLSGLFGFLASLAMPDFNAVSPKPDDAPLPFRLMFGMFDYFRILAAVQAIVGGLTIWAGAEFLRLRAWARAFLEGILWLVLAYTIAFGVFWIWSIGSMMDGADSPLLPAMMAAMGVVSFLMFAIPAVIVIRVLRGPTVRQAMVSGPART